MEASGNEREYGYQIFFDDGSFKYVVYEGSDGEVGIATTLEGKRPIVSVHAHNGIGTRNPVYFIPRALGLAPDMNPQEMRPSGKDYGVYPLAIRNGLVYIMGYDEAPHYRPILPPVS